jgi:hypothetical protein
MIRKVCSLFAVFRLFSRLLRQLCRECEVEDARSGVIRSVVCTGPVLLGGGGVNHLGNFGTRLLVLLKVIPEAVRC